MNVGESNQLVPLPSFSLEKYKCALHTVIFNHSFTTELLPIPQNKTQT